MSRRQPYVFPKPESTPPSVWRSLDEQEEPNSVSSTQEAEAEFPQGVVSAQSLTMGRRDFLTLSSAIAAVIGMEGCIRRPVEKIMPFAKGPEHVIPGLPLHFATAVDYRGEALGLLVESHEGRPTKVEGNPKQYASRGASDAVTQALIMDLYDPDRAKQPTSRADGQTKTVSPKQALEALDAQLNVHAGDQGAGLRIVAPPSISPTYHRLLGRLSQRFPKAKLVHYAAVNNDHATQGSYVAFGKGYGRVLDYSKARTILSLDCDFLQSESGSTLAARQFAQGRSLESADSDMNRLYVVEPALSLTGTKADHRLPMAHRDVGIYVLALASYLKDKLTIDIDGNILDQHAKYGLQVPSAWISQVANDLLKHRGASLIVVGHRQPPYVHALADALNKALSNVGQTLSYLPQPQASETSGLEKLSELAQDLRQGNVKTLIMLEGNPLFDAPPDFKLPQLLQQVGLYSLHLSSHANETSEQCSWHIPCSHPFEAWGDYQASDGSIALQQPLIAPLWQSMSTIELLAHVAGVNSTKGHDLVRQSAAEYLGKSKPLPLHGEKGEIASPSSQDDSEEGAAANTGAKPSHTLLTTSSFEDQWRRSLHQGVLEKVTVEQVTKSPPMLRTNIENNIREALQQGPSEALSVDNLEVIFAVDAKLIDGRHANNPWLLELPDPVSKVSWGNAAIIAPATARDLGLRDGDVIRLTDRQSQSIEIPALVLPGQAPWTITLPIGWGRPKVGTYGTGVGFNVQPLRAANAFYVSEGIRVKKTAKRHRLTQTQTHHTMEGRPIAIDATRSEYQKQPDFASWRTVEMSIPPLWEQVDYTGRHKWGMAIDLTTCTGCNACVVACQSENNIPTVGQEEIARGRDMYWMRIDRYFMGDDIDNPQVAVQPVACQHCEEAPCENVCPVNATVHSPEGTNDMAYNRCVGTRYCMNNCPYKVRRFNYLSWHDRDPHGKVPETRKMQFNPNVTVRMRGVMEKCTYCIQRIQQAKITSKREHRELKDGDVTTACQQACPAQAIMFGDLNDPKSRVRQWSKRDRRYALLAEVGTQPRTSFLANIRNPNPAMKTKG